MKENAASGDLAFVVQKHRATSLHYDFRLQIGDTMPSWSIPKGPTLDNTVKRLAMRTEDHPLEYRHFEGVIGEGRYGAGVVMIWDEGTYRPEVEISRGVRKEVTVLIDEEEIASRQLNEGELKFRLYGRRLKGSFALVRTRMIPGKETWLLLKHADAYAKKGYSASDYDSSVVSGLTVEQIASANEKDK